MIGAQRQRTFPVVGLLGVFGVLWGAGCAGDSPDRGASLATVNPDDAGAPGDSAPADRAPAETGVERGCTDRDGDGHGLGCAAGPDCDDGDAQVTTECTECLRPATGCECAPDAPAVPCNLETGTTAPSSEGVCRLGQRSCREGRWSACEAYDARTRVLGSAVACSGSCDPSCRHFVDCIELGDPIVPVSSGVEIGAMAPAVFCPTGTGAGGVTPICDTNAGGPYNRLPSTQGWIEACTSSSVPWIPSSDEGIASIALPFTFPFYGVPYSMVQASANGMVSFATAASEWVNSTLPAATVPNTVFAFWDDLILRNTGVCTTTVGTAPHRQFVIEWKDAGFYPIADPTTHLTFEIVLDEYAKTVDVVYQTMQGLGDRATGSSATVGVQEGSGASFDLVAYNTPGVVTGGTRFRWAPSNNVTVCASGVYDRVYEAVCDPADLSVGPVWGVLNYTSQVPTGGAIHWEARVSDTQAGLASATPLRLPDAPRGASGVPSSLDVGMFLRATQRGLERMRFLQLTARLDPGAGTDAPPTLGSFEMQYACIPTEITPTCRAGTECFTAGVCRRGQIACRTSAAAYCEDHGALPAGTACGTNQVCNAVGACVSCTEGAACDTGNACDVGRISCATGAPVCVAATHRAPGTVCAVSSGNYTRSTSPFGWLDACSSAGRYTVLDNSHDDVVQVPLPFPFRFYGAAYTSVGLSSNGVMGFPSTTGDFDNHSLPYAPLGNAIMPFWDDLRQRTGVCVATFGAAPDRLFVAQWSEADLEDRGTTNNVGARLNFEVVLEESSQAVSVIYGAMEGDSRVTGSSATIGVQRADGMAFDQVSHDTAGAVVSGSSIRWMPPIAGTCNNGGMCQACATTETCDGLDNNCNALVDDGIPDISCGVGACRRTAPGCVHGAAGTCTPGSPTPEVCNHIDDNCNGTVDEGCTGTLSCPSDTTIFAGNAVSLSAVTTGNVTNLLWDIVSGPTGGPSVVGWSPTTRNAVTENITPIIVGVYRVQITGVDGYGSPLSCAFNLTAQTRGLRVQLTWDGAGDLDVHLHNSNNTPWYTADDTYYGRMSSPWGATLDVDNVTANGPENIRMNSPAVGSTYTVAVHHYANGAGRRATIQIFCGLSGVTPVATYVSAPLSGNSSGNCTSNSFWRVARVTMTASSCTVTPLNTITSSNNACSGL